MIDLEGFSSDKLLNGINTAAEQAQILLHRIDMTAAEKALTPEQLKDMHQAKKDLDAIKSKDFEKINAILNRFKQ